MKLLSTILISVSLLAIGDKSIRWINPEHDFGEIQADEYVEHDFVFFNDREEPIVIENVRVTCGCTTPFYTEAPIMPGDSGRVAIRYNPKGRKGYFRKTITVFFDGIKGKHPLRISGTILDE